MGCSLWNLICRIIKKGVHEVKHNTLYILKWRGINNISIYQPLMNEEES